jgi:hypothetical protein
MALSSHDRGGGTLGLASDGKDGKTRNSKARPGSWAVNEDRNIRAPKTRQGSLASDASKSHQKTKEAAHHPAYWGSGMHRRASAGEDEKDWPPKATQMEDAVAWVQAKEASYAQKKTNHAAHQGSGTRSPPGRTALLGSAAMFGPATTGKNKGRTGEGVSAAKFSPATQMPTHAAHQGGGTRSPQGAATLLSGAGLFRSNADKKNSREYRAGRKRCQFLISSGTPVQRRGCYSPWGPWGKPQPPNGGGLVHQKPGENRTGRKCCRFFTGPGTL